jgi:hypothetical protein
MFAGWPLACRAVGRGSIKRWGWIVQVQHSQRSCFAWTSRDSCSFRHWTASRASLHDWKSAASLQVAAFSTIIWRHLSNKIVNTSSVASYLPILHRQTHPQTAIMRCIKNRIEHKGSGEVTLCPDEPEDMVYRSTFPTWTPQSANIPLW